MKLKIEKGENDNLSLEYREESNVAFLVHGHANMQHT